MESLKEEQMAVILNLVNYYSQTDLDVFERICDEELQDPVSDEIIENVVASERTKACAGTHCN